MLSLRNILSALLLTILTCKLSAVSVTTRGIKNPAIYGIEFSGDTRAYYGKEENIQSISTQEYVTANFRVIELNIVTQGTALVRIYYSRPLRIGELQQAMGNGLNAAGAPGSSIIQRPLPAQVQAMADRAAGISEAVTGTEVMKEYPIATHAHTIEYRIGSRDELIELHDQLKKHWLKEPAYFEGGQIVDEADATSKEMKPRHLGGTLFKVEG
ncbi:hypothetical protein SH580_09675 [Coraliomargarita algicola]|uniref:Uncharacterized protein n=1 Tax=Coraliomargarita algicola TaxID=3092156 RepID=A0ABZ0RS25_9BACT|nr:hypothetical protein [Coraliomargarita sp. J2-16]WPJ97978.1 hypothetical protein SH580_09675 [Coraliomargarita sp. J2-16]